VTYGKPWQYVNKAVLSSVTEGVQVKVLCNLLAKKYDNPEFRYENLSKVFTSRKLHLEKFLCLANRFPKLRNSDIMRFSELNDKDHRLIDMLRNIKREWDPDTEVLDYLTKFSKIQDWPDVKSCIETDYAMAYVYKVISESGFKLKSSYLGLQVVQFMSNLCFTRVSDEDYIDHKMVAKFFRNFIKANGGDKNAEKYAVSIIREANKSHRDEEALLEVISMFLRILDSSYKDELLNPLLYYDAKIADLNKNLSPLYRRARFENKKINYTRNEMDLFCNVFEGYDFRPAKDTNELVRAGQISGWDIGSLMFSALAKNDLIVIGYQVHTRVPSFYIQFGSLDDKGTRRYVKRIRSSMNRKPMNDEALAIKEWVESDDTISEYVRGNIEYSHIAEGNYIGAVTSGGRDTHVLELNKDGEVIS
jgi:hypothetical protein